MNERHIDIFIRSLQHYFKQISPAHVEIGVPYLIDETVEVDSEFTGIIEISGNYKGSCYFTAPKSLLEEIIDAVGDDDQSNEMLRDTVGEVANILSGNAQSELGQGFIISPPKVYHGKNSAQAFAINDTYAIPVHWRDRKAHLCVTVH